MAWALVLDDVVRSIENNQFDTPDALKWVEIPKDVSVTIGCRVVNNEFIPSDIKQSTEDINKTLLHLVASVLLGSAKVEDLQIFVEVNQIKINKKQDL